MNKSLILSSLLALALVSFTGCQSTGEGAGMDPGPGTYQPPAGSKNYSRKGAKSVQKTEPDVVEEVSLPEAESAVDPVPVTQAPSTESSSASVTAPAPAVSPVPTQTTEYVVVAGDSLWKIARSHNTNVKTIKDLNGLTNDVIKPGQKLKVPAVTSPAP